MIHRKEGESWRAQSSTTVCFAGRCSEPIRATRDTRNTVREPDCRKASKAASQRAWLAKAQNQDYFRGPENVARVQLWRAAHPGYWRRAKGDRRDRPAAPVALQDLCPAQAIEIAGNSQERLAPCVTRSLAGPTGCSDWLYRPIYGFHVAR